MQVKATKVLAKELNKRIGKYNIECVKMTERQYRNYVDIDFWSHENDYNCVDNTYSVIVVEYPSNYYACNNYLTTNDLLRVFRKLQDKTLDNFARAIFNEIEI